MRHNEVLQEERCLRLRGTCGEEAGEGKGCCSGQPQAFLVDVDFSFVKHSVLILGDMKYITSIKDFIQLLHKQSPYCFAT